MRLSLLYLFETMKTLYFCRHAKSDWSTTLPDHERPLNARGEKSAPLMLGIWKKLESIPTHWVSSSAKRALQTAQIMSTEYSGNIDLRVEHKLYHANVNNWMEIIRHLPEEISSCALFGHNPGITDVVNLLSESDISNIPTCGLAKITFSFDQWELISKGTGTLEWFEYPKKHASL